MGYQIRYRGIGKIRYGDRRRTGLGALTGLTFLIFLLLVQFLWPEGMAVVREGLRPVWRETIAAVETFSDDLQQGGLASDAVETFLNTFMRHDTVLEN